MPYSEDETESENDDPVIRVAPAVIIKMEAEILQNRQRINVLCKELEQIRMQQQQKQEEAKEDSNVPKKR